MRKPRAAARALLVALSVLFSAGAVSNLASDAVGDIASVSEAVQYEDDLDGVEAGFQGLLAVLSLLGFEYLGSSSAGHYMARSVGVLSETCIDNEVSPAGLVAALGQHEQELKELLNRRLIVFGDAIGVEALRLEIGESGELQFEVVLHIRKRVEPGALLRLLLKEATETAEALLEEKIQRTCLAYGQTKNIFSAAREVVQRQLRESSYGI